MDAWDATFRKWQALAAALLAGIASMASVLAVDERGFRVWEEKSADRKLVYFENEFYRVAFVPELAMFPLFYFHKPTGADLFIRRAEIEQSFAQGDGIQLCLPWVGDTAGDLPSKGLLPRANWETTFRAEGGAGHLEALAEIHYQDPLTQTPGSLVCLVKVAGRMGSPDLTIGIEIKNTGEEIARFMFAAHARLAPDGTYRDGDFLLPEAESAWVGDFRWPQLSAAGVVPHSWTTWPVPGVSPFRTGENAAAREDFVYAFVPARRILVGNPGSKNLIDLRVDSVRIADEPTAAYVCILRRHGDYLVEISASRAIDAKHWEMEGATVGLRPGQTWEMMLSLSAEPGGSQINATSPGQNLPGRQNFFQAGP